jgi:hypothetical protein
MSSDNCIGILKTIDSKGSGYEYRVSHILGLDNLNWDDKAKTQTNDPDVLIKNAREMWSDCKVHTNEADAVTEAVKQAEDVFFLEYGICTIEIERVF